MLLFLAAFLVPRVADLHSFEHLLGDEDTTTCELCDIASHSHELDVFINDTSVKEQPISSTPSKEVIPSLYDSPLAMIATPTWVYNKPPPVAAIGS